jgi:DNA-directed RNA polymerase, beta subunit/140 kD subunit
MYENLKRQHGDKLVLHPNLHRMIVWAYAFTNHRSVQQPNGARVNLTYRRAPVGDFRTEIVFKYDIIPSVGSKVTNCHGGKGVIVQIREPEDMPHWPDGTTADLVMDNDSNIKRMNLGGPFEQATNAFGAQLTRRAQVIMAQPGVIQTNYNQAWEELMEYYSIVSPLMHEFMVREMVDVPRRNQHVDAVLKDGIYLWLPPHTPDIGSEIIDRLDRRYGLEMHPVTYRDSNGNLTTTKQKMLIGETYIIMLEKNGFDWSSVASPKRQHFGILARMTNMDKHSTPGRENAVRITGEAEIRLLLALIPDYVVADLLDRPNNPAAHKAEVRSILEAKNPARIELAVDRRKVPLGGNRAIQFIRHIMWCCGITLTSVGKRVKGLFK